MICVFIDLSGTVYNGTQIVPKTVEGIQLLEKNPNVQYCFVSNATSHTRDGLYETLSSMGLGFIDKNRIFSSGELVKTYIESKNLNPFYIVEDSLMNDLPESRKDIPYTCVVIGMTQTKLNYDNLNEGFRIVLNGGELIGLNTSYYNIRDNGYNLAPGDFINLIAKAADVEPTILGKPNPSFFHSIMDILKIKDSSSIYMIGDDVVNDVNGIQSIGGHGILVKTGKYRPNDEFNKGIFPEKTCDTLFDAIQYVLSRI